MKNFFDYFLLIVLLTNKNVLSLQLVKQIFYQKY